MKIYNFTHNDLDGAGCAIAVNQKFGSAVEKTYFCNYDSIDEELQLFLKNPEVISEDTFLLITDICPQLVTCKKLDKYYNKINILLIDHHKTKNWLKDFGWTVFSEKHSATYLTDQHLNENSNITELSKTIDAWDLWKLDSPFRKRSEHLNELVRFLGLHEFTNVFTENSNADLEEPFSTILLYLEKNKERYINRILANQIEKSKIRMDGLGNSFKILFADDYVSNVGHAVLSVEEDLKYVVIISLEGSTCSLRSVNNFDVSKIAQRCGGGGHKNAAGFPIKIKENIESKIFTMLNKITDD